MLIPENVKIYLYALPTDMRKSIDGLMMIVKHTFQLNPFQSSLFLFCGQRRDRMKALFWEGDGFVFGGAKYALHRQIDVFKAA